MSFVGGFTLGAICGGMFGAMILMLFTSGKVSDLYDRIDELELKHGVDNAQERVL